MKNLYKSILISAFICFFSQSFAQINGDFQSAATGNWNSASTWQIYNSGWGAASNPPAGTETITIQSGHTLTLDVPVSISGLLKNSGGTLVDGGNLTIAATGTYEHASNTTIIPTATWSVGSTLLVTGITNATSFTSGGSQSFYNITWNCPNETMNIVFNFGWPDSYMLRGSLTVTNTGNLGTKLYLTDFAGTETKSITINGDVVINGGYLSLAHSSTNFIGNVLIKGNLSISSGYLNLFLYGTGTNPTVTWNLEGNLSISGGTLTTYADPSPTFTFSGSSTQNFTKSSGTITSTGSSGVINFIVNSGSTLNMGTSVLDGNPNFTLNSGATIQTGHSTGLSSTTFSTTGTKTFNSGANYVFNGSTTFQSTGALMPTAVNNFTINNTYSTPRVTLSGNLTVNSTLTLTSGRLNLSSYNLTLGSSATIGGTPSSSAMIYSSSTGELRKTFSSNGSFTFPIGEITGTTEYSPCYINLTADVYSSAYIGVNVTNLKHSSNTSSTDYLSRYWTLSSSGLTNPNYSAEFTYVDADITGTESNLYGGKYNGSVWSTLGAVDALNNKVTASGQTSFSDFTAGESGALPVELSSFSLSYSGGFVTLNWETANEVNNFGFEIERQVSSKQSVGGNWDKIGFVNGNGNSNSPKDYSFADKTILSGKYSYRLKQIDNDGKYEYSKAIEVDLGTPNKFSLSQNYPNPFNPVTTIKFGLPEASKVNLKLFSVIGEEVAELINEEKPAGFHQVEFDASKFSSGIYFYELNAGTFRSIKKMILLR